MVTAFLVGVVGGAPLALVMATDLGRGARIIAALLGSIIAVFVPYVYTLGHLMVEGDTVTLQRWWRRAPLVQGRITGVEFVLRFASLGVVSLLEPASSPSLALAVWAGALLGQLFGVLSESNDEGNAR